MWGQIQRLTRFMKVMGHTDTPLLWVGASGNFVGRPHLHHICAVCPQCSRRSSERTQPCHPRLTLAATVGAPREVWGPLHIHAEGSFAWDRLAWLPLPAAQTQKGSDEAFCISDLTCCISADAAALAFSRPAGMGPALVPALGTLFILSTVTPATQIMRYLEHDNYHRTTAWITHLDDRNQTASTTTEQSTRTGRSAPQTILRHVDAAKRCSAAPGTQLVQSCLHRAPGWTVLHPGRLCSFDGAKGFFAQIRSKPRP